MHPDQSEKKKRGGKINGRSKKKKKEREKERTIYH